MGRMLTSTQQNTPGVLLAICAGGVLGLVSVSGCAGGKRAGDDQSAAVNTGLANLDRASALELPDPDALMTPTRDEAMIRSQIEESARQLSVYFTNLEIDGPPDVGGVTPPPRATSPGTRASSSLDTTGEPQRASASPRPVQPNPVVGSGDDGGVRVSLRDLAGSSGESEIAEPDALVEESVQVVPAKADEQAGAGVSGADASAHDGGLPADPRARRDALAKELAGILSGLVESGQDPGASALALASLEMLIPDDTGSLVDAGVLSEPERASIDAVRSLLSSMTSEGEIASPDAVSGALETIKTQLDAWAGLTIRRAALCTRVDGYGRYETFPSYRFIAGQAQEVIVYTEVDRFAQRTTTGPDGQARYGLELSQRLELYHVADDLNTWNRAAETLRDESRNRLRDYYLTNRVWLPSNLGVGRYHLKIVMRDLLGDKVAETILPIEIVAR